jgi:hypothetical protein
MDSTTISSVGGGKTEKSKSKKSVPKNMLASCDDDYESGDSTKILNNIGNKLSAPGTSKFAGAASNSSHQQI